MIPMMIKMMMLMMMTMMMIFNYIGADLVYTQMYNANAFLG
jgi:ribosomal protein S18 acetylase RimI-like enzyme